MNKQLEMAFRYYVRYIIQIPSVYRPDGSPHIFIFSTRRSGSTLLRDMIASQSSFNFIDEPLNFSWFQYNPYRKIFPKNQRGQIIDLSEDLEKVMWEYLEGLLARKYITRSQWKVFGEHYHWSWNRYVVKDLNCKNIIPQIQKYFGERARIIYHIRHPFAVASSLLRTNWESYYPLFINDSTFRQRYLTEKILSVAKKVDAYGSRAEKFVLDWCLENYLPLKVHNDVAWIKTSYENITTSPASAAKMLCYLLNLPDSDAMIDVVRKPSPTSHPKSRVEIKREGPVSCLERWKSEFSSEQISRFMDILSAFKISIYDSESSFPMVEVDSI